MADDPTPYTLWPRWMESVGAIQGIGAHVRSRCSRCGTLQRINLADMVASRGPAWSLIDALDRCAIVGCAGSIYYLAARAYDRPWTILVRDENILEAVVEVTPLVRALT